MSIKINYKNNNLNKSLMNLVLFVDENFNIKGLKKYISNSEFDKYFFKSLILKFSSTNKTRLVADLFEILFL